MEQENMNHENIVLYSNPIPISKFQEYVKDSNSIKYEYEQLNPPDKQLNYWDISLIYENLKKHRYSKHPDILLTYDHTRVVLNLTNTKYSDFICANWVDGYNQSKKYIATQCPTESTVDDFYRMIWQYNIQQIINLASPMDMELGGYKYYPNDIFNFDKIQIKLISMEILPDLIIRRYNLEKDNESRPLTHFHFQSWPDLDTPEHPKQILDLIKAYRTDILYDINKPLVVHCMAGVGRSGTFILTDSMYQMSQQTLHLDFLSHLWKIRNQRIAMAEKSKQYLYAHQAIAFYLEK